MEIQANEITLPEFWDKLNELDWQYMNPAEDRLPQEDAGENRGKHILYKDIALRRHKDGFADLYLAFEDHAYYFKPKPERPV